MYGFTLQVEFQWPSGAPIQDFLRAGLTAIGAPAASGAADAAADTEHALLKTLEEEHWVTSVGELRVLVQEGMLRQVPMPARLWLWMEAQLGLIKGNQQLARSPVAAAGLVNGVADAAEQVSLSIATTPARAPILFAHKSDMDTNGLLYWLGTGRGTRPWKNPALTGEVHVTSIGMMNDSVPESAICGRTVERCVTVLRPEAWIALELRSCWLAPTHYTLRHYSSWDTECLRNWRLEASRDGGASWTLLREHKNDEGLWGKGSTFTWSLPLQPAVGVGSAPADQQQEQVIEAPAYYRHFRLVLTGPNSHNHNYMACSGLELYGFALDGPQDPLMAPVQFLPASAAAAVAASPMPLDAVASVALAGPAMGPERLNAVVRERCAAAGTFFQHQADFDHNGVLWNLATTRGTRPWQNPALAGIVSVAASSLVDNSAPIEALVGQDTVRLVTRAVPNSWMGVDLGPQTSLRPTAYTLRHYLSWDTEALRHWELQGSLDGQSWTAIRVHKDDQGLAKKGASYTWILHDDPHSLPPAYRFFRLQMTGLNSNNHYHLACSGLELYGWLMQADGVTPYQFPVEAAAAAAASPAAAAASPAAAVADNVALVSPSPVAAVQPQQAVPAPPLPAQHIRRPSGAASPSPPQPPQPAVNPFLCNNELAVHRLGLPGQPPVRHERLAWAPDQHGPLVQLGSSEQDGRGLLDMVVNVGAEHKWQLAKGLQSFDKGKHMLAVRVNSDPPTTNTWKFIVGVVPAEFDAKGSKQWVGALGSWGWIGGTGGRCHVEAKSVTFDAEAFGLGDVVGLLLDFDEGTLTFFKNGQPQPVAFRNLRGPVHVAVSMTGPRAQLQLVSWDTPPGVPQLPAVAALQQQQAAAAVPAVVPAAATVAGSGSRCVGRPSPWDPNNRSVYMEISPADSSVCTNTGTQDKWQYARSLHCFSPEKGPLQSFEIEILRNPPTNNNWVVIVGLVPAEFPGKQKKLWIGASGSWGYIGGTGGKCNNEPKSVDYGEPFGAHGDVIRVDLNYSTGTVSFSKNGISMGVAFTDLAGPTHAAVSFTAAHAQARFCLI